MTKLYFIRHGKTKWNNMGIYQGANQDSPLLESSYNDIRRLANYLMNIRFVHLYSSPIHRAVVTSTELISNLHQKIPMTLDSRLKEFDFGKIEGMKFDDVKRRYPNEYDGLHRHAEKYSNKKVGGETFQDVIKRMSSIIYQIVKQHINVNDNVLIVSHGAALNAAINFLLGKSLCELRSHESLLHGSTTILETLNQGKSFKLIKKNITSYLDQL